MKNMLNKMAEIAVKELTKKAAKVFMGFEVQSSVTFFPFSNVIILKLALRIAGTNDMIDVRGKIPCPPGLVKMVKLKQVVDKETDGMIADMKKELQAIGFVIKEK